MKSARRRSRELALQGLYAWQLSGEAVAGLRSQLADSEDFDKADAAYFDTLLKGTIEQAADIEQQLAPALDRKPEQLSPVERGILLLAAFELRSSPEVPYKVVINEAVELAKAFGGTDGHKYVNGVLDRIARVLRPSEAAQR
jgi:transcription antitermination protein NusB